MSTPSSKSRGFLPSRSKDSHRRIHERREWRPPLYLSRAILALAGIVLFLPLFVSYDFYYPYIFLKSILFRIAVQMMVFLYVLLAVMSPSHRPRLNRISYALLAYFGALLLSSLPGISVDAWSSWWGSFFRMGGMISQLHLLAYFFVLTQTLKRERDWLALFAASLFCGVLMGFSGLVQYLDLDFLYRVSDPENRIKGATGNPNFFAASMMLNFFIVLWFLSRKDRREIYSFVAGVWLYLLLILDCCLIVRDVVTAGRNPGILLNGLAVVPVASFFLILHGAGIFWFFMRRRIRIGDVFLGVLGLYYLFWITHSGTRSAMVGIAGSLTLLSLLYIWTGTGKRMKWTAAMLVLLVIMLPAAVWLNRDSAWVKNQPAFSRFTSIPLSPSDVRLAAWKSTALSILDRPVFGWGIENHKNAFDFHFPPQIFLVLQSEVWFDRAHNVLLDAATAAGFVGLAAYLIFYMMVFAFLLRLWFRTKDVSKSLMIAAILVSYIFQSLFSFDTVNTDGIVFLVLAYVAHLFGLEGKEPAREAVRRPVPISIRWPGRLIIGGSAAVLIAACWYVVKEPYDSNLLLNRGIGLERMPAPQTGSPRYVFREEIIDLFQSASDYQTTGRHEVREEFANYASELVQSAEVPLDEKVFMVKRAMAALEESVPQAPFYARHYMYLASLVNKSFSVLQQSDAALARSLAEKNLVLLQRAESLSPTRPQIFLERSQSLLNLGRTEEAISAMEKARDLSPKVKEPHVDLVALYIVAGRFEDAEKEWQEIKSLSLPLGTADYERVIRLYNAKKYFAPIVALYQEQLDRSPGDGLLMARLAATYRDMGEVESARQTALKAAALSPQIAAELEGFLNSLNK